MVLNNTDRLKGWQCLAAPVAYKPPKKQKGKIILEYNGRHWRDCQIQNVRT